MQVPAQEYRHAVLIAAIVAVAPLIFFPNDLGLRLQLAPLAFFAIELAFYFVIFAAFMGKTTFAQVLGAGAICLGARLVTGVAFAFLILFTHPVALPLAFTSGLYDYKPAMLLQVVSFPFILMPIFKYAFASERSTRTRVFAGSHEQTSETPARPTAARTARAERKIIGVRQTPTDTPAPVFDAPLKYIGELAGVQFAVLIEERGLPVGFFGREQASRDQWAAVGRFLFDSLKLPLLTAEQHELEMIELTVDSMRLHVVKVDTLYLAVGVDREVEELEKVRILQAADMIRKLYSQRYMEPAGAAAREERYVPSLS